MNKKLQAEFEAWARTASDRDIQVHQLRVAVETREKIETIRGIISFLFILWLIGVVLLLIGAFSSDSNDFGAAILSWVAPV